MDVSNSKDTLPENATAEAIAYRLFLHVMDIEDRSLVASKAGARVNRGILLDTYSDCLEAAKGNRPKRVVSHAA